MYSKYVCVWVGERVSVLICECVCTCIAFTDQFTAELFLEQLLVMIIQ